MLYLFVLLQKKRKNHSFFYYLIFPGFSRPCSRDHCGTDCAVCRATAATTSIQTRAPWDVSSSLPAGAWGWCWPRWWPWSCPAPCPWPPWGWGPAAQSGPAGLTILLPLSGGNFPFSGNMRYVWSAGSLLVGWFVFWLYPWGWGRWGGTTAHNRVLVRLSTVHNPREEILCLLLGQLKHSPEGKGKRGWRKKKEGGGGRRGKGGQEKVGRFEPLETQDCRINRKIFKKKSCNSITERLIKQVTGIKKSCFQFQTNVF